MSSTPTRTTTHERFLQAARDAVIAHAVAAGTITDEQASELQHAKLLYGIGDGSYRGICHYEAWENGVGKVAVIEVAASAQESFVQLAGTTLHELAHVLAGWGAGHGAAWKESAVALGFTIKPAAAGQVYNLSMFAPDLRFRIYSLAAEIGDGHPAFKTFGWGALGISAIKPCSAGYGTRGGTSRGKGSGSRQRLWECKCERPVKVRTASDDFKAHCDRCGAAFERR